MTDIVPPAGELGSGPLAIELIGIDKRFGPVHANHDIHIQIAKASIHGIIGENGAGKSTLMSILYGFYEADSGEIRVDGRPATIRSSSDAIALGIGMVHQQFMLIDTFTVLENIILGAEGDFLLGRAERRARELLKRLSRDYGLAVDPDALVGGLSVGEQQRVEILKALYRGAQVLILDEPTAVLTPGEADHLFEVLRQLKAEGKTVIIITHKLREIMAVTDTVSVMRRGEMVTTVPTVQTTMPALAEAMVGRRVLLRVDKKPSIPGAPVLEAVKLGLTDPRGIKLFDDISFQVRAGEIVGIAGVAGNGQSELLEVLAGIRPATSGSVLLNGREITGIDPAEARGKGIAHLPEDRHRVGLVLPFEARENTILGYQNEPDNCSGPFLDRTAILARATREFAEYDVRPPNPMLRTALFSGGNQQKIVVAREIERDPIVLLVGQPTRGVDIGAIEFIHRRLIELRDKGKAILLVSAELDEIRSLSDRVIVMCGGVITGECSPEIPDGEIGLMMAGVVEPAHGAAQEGVGPLSARPRELPLLVDYVLLPALNLSAAFLVAGLLVMLIGESPWLVIRTIVYGSVGTLGHLGYTLHYATNFIFTGLAVAIAFHGGLFNIGAEGQIMIAGLGTALVCLGFDGAPWWMVFPFALVGAMVFGAGWALVPAWLQAKRGSHIVITTMMFNFLAFSVLNYILVHVLSQPGSMSTETESFSEATRLPSLSLFTAPFGISFGVSPLNPMVLVALLAAVGVWLLIWRTRFGYELRTFGTNPAAAAYAGIDGARIAIVAMLLSGGLAGLMAVNMVMGEFSRLTSDFTSGAGFVGIAVALMGRSHPFGIVLAAILFGILYQGGAELAFESPKITRDMIIVIQGLIILFAGALEHMFRPALEWIFAAPRREAAQG